ncbi:MAG: PorT family protein, partial [Pedobacter sp.]
MRTIIIALLYLTVSPLFAQTANEVKAENDSIALVADPRYREDQFYASIAYHSIQNKPSGFSQSSFSTALSVGFLRDMPINKARNHAIAVGLGYSYNNIKNNLKITGVDDMRTYEIIPEDDFDKNKLVFHSVDIPIEFRWRNSDSVSHKFWRVYAGFKASYVFYNKSQFEDGTGTIKLRDNPDMNKLLYG